MFTISDYLNQLDEDKDTLYNNLINADISASSDETFTTLTPKVSEITTNYASLFKPIINITGAGITDESFSQYPDKLNEGLINVLNNGTDVIFNNYPNKETKEGTSFTIYNTINAKMKINLKGNTSQNGTPTPLNPVEIKTVQQENHISKTGTSSDSYFITLPKENKFESISTILIDGITLTNNGDESYLLNGTATNNTIMFSKSVNFPPGIYTIKANNPVADSKVRIRLEWANGSVSFLTCNVVNNILKVGITERVTSIAIWCVNTPTLNNFYLRPEILIDGFEGIELCEIGDYQDYIFKQNNKWYVHKEIGKVVLNGSENWSTNGENENYGQYRLNNFTEKANGLLNLISNRFITELSNTKNCIAGRDSLPDIFINIEKNIVSYSASDFKAWLSTHNTVVYYALATPTNTQITDDTLLNQLNILENAKSNDGNTTLASYSDNNQEVFYLDVTALKEESNNG